MDVTVRKVIAERGTVNVSRLAQYVGLSAIVVTVKIMKVGKRAKKPGLSRAKEVKPVGIKVDSSLEKVP